MSCLFQSNAFGLKWPGVIFTLFMHRNMCLNDWTKIYLDYHILFCLILCVNNITLFSCLYGICCELVFNFIGMN